MRLNLKILNKINHTKIFKKFPFESESNPD